MYSYDHSKTAAFDPNTIKAIRRLTQRNDHTRAYIEGSKMLGLSQLMKKFTLVKQLEELEQHLPSGLGNYRYTLYEDLMSTAKSMLSEDEYQQFYMSF